MKSMRRAWTASLISAGCAPIERERSSRQSARVSEPRKRGAGPHRVAWMLAISLLGLLLPKAVSADDGPRDWVVGLGPALFAEDTNQRQKTVRFGETERSDDTLDSRGVYNLNAWGLTKLGLLSHLWGGGGLAWYNKYTLQPSEGDEDERYEAGHLFQIYGQLDYQVPRLVGDFSLLMGARGGPLLLLSSGQLQEQLDELSDRGYGVWSTPRFGVFVAPHVGGSWPLTPRIALRGDLGVQFQRVWLFNARAEAAGITTQQQSLLSTTRTQLLLGLEVSL